VVNLWLAQKDLRYRWAEVKRIFWEEFGHQLPLSGKRRLEESLKVEYERRRPTSDPDLSKQLIFSCVGTAMAANPRLGVLAGGCLRRL